MITFAWLLLAAADVQVTASVKTPLSVTAGGQLRGRIDVTIRNAGDAAVALEHADVHGLRFEVPDGPPSLVVHSCDCAFVLGQQAPPEARRFTLQPREEKRIIFDDFSCSGGPFLAPKPGRYLLRYRLGPPAPAGAPFDGGFDRSECERRLRNAPGPGDIVSPGVDTPISASKKLRQPRGR